MPFQSINKICEACKDTSDNICEACKQSLKRKKSCQSQAKYRAKKRRQELPQKQIRQEMKTSFSILTNRLPITFKLLKQLFSKIKVSTEHFYKGIPCWEWQGKISDNGYGIKEFHAKQVRAHRLIYELFVEIIPHPLQCDHLCRVRHCVNPVHIEPVTQRENLLRGHTVVARNALKTHCPRKHELSGKNLIQKYGKRECRICAYTLGKLRRKKQSLLLRKLPHPRDRTHCPKNHPYTEGNLIVYRGGRFCKACRIARNIARRVINKTI